MSAKVTGDVRDSTTVCILDSHALLAYLGGEAREGRVKQILHDASSGESRALMSLINLGEVVYITERERGLVKAQQVLAILEQLPVEILNVDRQTVMAAAHLKVHFPVAYANAFPIAAAQMYAGVLLTGDPEFEAVKEVVRIEWIGG
jgi:predicted nucleic acid-binding protein